MIHMLSGIVVIYLGKSLWIWPHVYALLGETLTKLKSSVSPLISSTR